jgi:hypothetical protein
MELPYEKDLAAMNLTKDEAARMLYGRKATFDCSLPQPWVDDLLLKHGFDPVPCVVWLYRKGDVFGKAAPLTFEARRELKRIYGDIGYKNFCGYGE